MLSRRISDFLRGFLQFRVVGGFLPEFLALCSQNAIGLERTEPYDGGMTAYTPLCNAAALEQAAAKAGMTLEILRRGGLPPLFRRYRLRWGIPAGLLAGAILAGLLSSMVWSVRVTGCETIPEDEILLYFNENGVRKGVFRAGIDVAELRERAVMELEGILWITLHIDGCFAEIEVRERGIVPVVPEKNVCYNLVAARDGELLRTDVLAGESDLQPGQPVVKGDLLVSGTVPLKNGGVRLVRAQAEIVARTHRSLTVSIERRQKVERFTVARNVVSLSLFGLRLPLWFHGKADCTETTASYLAAGETVLPLGYERTQYRRTETAEITLPERQWLLWCLALYAEAELTALQDAATLERTLSLALSDDALTLTGAYICEEDICEEVRVELDDG